MKIIPATSQDENEIKALLRTCKLPSDDLTASILAHYFIISKSGKVAGCVGIEVCDQYGLLRSLAVSESLRGKGVGIQLVEQIEAYAGSQGIHTLYLLTTTADQFFTSIGYQVISRESAPPRILETSEFQHICPASAVCMQKELS